MIIQPIPLNNDNYGYLIIDEVTRECGIVDVSGQPEKVASIIRECDPPVNFTTIFTTHKHWDHAGGNNEMKKLFPHVKIYGSSIDGIEGCTDVLNDGDELQFGDHITIRCYLTPGHTMGHICYHFIESKEENDNSDPGVVFTGDTLFVGGVGKFFEGSGSDMYPALYHKLARLPPDTLVYCGHEYTLSNYRFCQYVEPDNHDLNKAFERAKRLQEQKIPTVPSSIQQELLTNVFLRVDQPSVKAFLGAVGEDPIEALNALREAKNNFK
jgi:hydroxyacylglutathione hydrolase